MASSQPGVKRMSKVEFLDDLAVVTVEIEGVSVTIELPGFERDARFASSERRARMIARKALHEAVKVLRPAPIEAVA